MKKIIALVFLFVALAIGTCVTVRQASATTIKEGFVGIASAGFLSSAFPR